MYADWDDDWARARLSVALGSIRQNTYSDWQGSRTELERALFHLRLVKQQVILVEMRARTQLGLTYSVLGLNDLAVPQLKTAVELEPGTYVPLLADMKVDREWKEQVDAIYTEAWMELITRAKAGDLTDAVISTKCFADILPTNHRNLARVSPMTVTPGGRDHFLAAKRIKKLIQDETLTAEQRQTLRDALLVLDAWTHREGSGNRKSIARILQLPLPELNAEEQ